MAFSGFTWNNYAPLRPLTFHDATHNLTSKALPDYGVLSQLSLHSYLTTLRISIGVSETCILLLSQRQDESTTACVRRKGLSERIKSFLWDLTHCVLSNQLYQIWRKLCMRYICMSRLAGDIDITVAERTLIVSRVFWTIDDARLWLVAIAVAVDRWALAPKWRSYGTMPPER